MALIDDVKAVCDQLAPLGWRELLKRITAGQLDIQQPTTAALQTMLAKTLTVIDRTQPGFEDFAIDGKQAVTPGLPAKSLLYHALACPNVLTDAVGNSLQGFPTLRQLEIVENYIFGVQPPTLNDLLNRAGATQLAIVVFAYEYRPAKDTCSGFQADLTFSRTGIARVGTAPMLYDPKRRGFWSEVNGDAFGFRVCPAHYGAFLAVRRKGERAAFLPMRHQTGDAQRDFWVPVHKLFDGKECLKGLNLQMTFRARLFNDKIRRIHVALGEGHVPTTPPFRFESNIAEIVTGPDLCQGLLVPTVHDRLIEPAMLNGNPVTFKVPKNNDSTFGSYEPGVDQDDFGEIRPAPAYIHARTKVQGGVMIDLNNTEADVRQAVAKGNYDALHYVDFTGDGEVTAICSGLGNQTAVAQKVETAYALIAAPDFFPTAGQRELTEWTTSNAVPASLRSTLWAVPPNPLCDVRLPANLQFPQHTFDPKETTIPALVPLFGSTTAATVKPLSRDAARHSCLPDDAAGVFAPGWDVSHDQLKRGNTKIPHLAAYGLGSPFPEDSKLCAALSTFWPTVAPDASRGMEPNPNSRLRATVAPLTDEEIGQSGILPWDGIAGPQFINVNGQLFAECASFFHADYVQNALQNRFSIRLTGRVVAEEYQRRVLAMARVYQALGGNRNTWFLFSFKPVTAGDPELNQAQMQAAATLTGVVYRFDIFRLQPSQPSPTDFKRRRLPINDRRFFFVDLNSNFVLQSNTTPTAWTKVIVNL